MRGPDDEARGGGEPPLSFVKRVEDIRPKQNCRCHMEDVQASRTSFNSVRPGEPASEHKEFCRKAFDPDDASAQVLHELSQDGTCFSGAKLSVEYAKFKRISELQFGEGSDNEDRPISPHFCDRSGGVRITAIKRNEKAGGSVDDQYRSRSEARSSAPVLETILSPKILLRRAAKSG